MQVRFAKDSWHRRFYRATYGSQQGDNPPDSLCPYFWLILLGVICLPLTGMFLIFRTTREGMSVGAKIFATGLILAFNGGAIEVGMDDTERGLLSAWLLGMKAILIFVMACAFGTILLVVLYNALKWIIRKKNDSVELEDSLIGARFAAFKDKVCPHIDWI